MVKPRTLCFFKEQAEQDSIKQWSCHQKESKGEEIAIWWLATSVNDACKWLPHSSWRLLLFQAFDAALTISLSRKGRQATTSPCFPVPFFWPFGKLSSLLPTAIVGIMRQLQYHQSHATQKNRLFKIKFRLIFVILKCLGVIFSLYWNFTLYFFVYTMTTCILLDRSLPTPSHAINQTSEVWTNDFPLKSLSLFTIGAFRFTTNISVTRFYNLSFFPFL